MKRGKQTIQKEYILLIIVFILICINAIIITILSLCVKGKYIENGTIQSIILGIEAIIIGISLFIAEKRIIKKEYPGCKEKCKGIVNKNVMHLDQGTNWSKHPVISYEVNNKKYQLTSSTGCNGLLSFLPLATKKTIYYNKENPQEAYVKNFVTKITALLFVVIGVVVVVGVIFMI